MAVGDAEFQRKRLGKMKQVSEGGRTILFVSHNMAAIQNLCSTAIYLKQGQLVQQGPTDQVIARYLSDAASTARVDLAVRKDRQGNGAIRFNEFMLTNELNEPIAAAQSGSPVVLQFSYEAPEPIRDLHVAVGIDDQYGQRITHLSNDVVGSALSTSNRTGRVAIRIPKCPLRSGNYAFTLFSTANGEIADYLLNAGTFHVESGDFFGTGRASDDDQGAFFVEHTFDIA